MSPISPDEYERFPGRFRRFPSERRLDYQEEKLLRSYLHHWLRAYHARTRKTAPTPSTHAVSSININHDRRFSGTTTSSSTTATSSDLPVEIERSIDRIRALQQDLIASRGSKNQLMQELGKFQPPLSSLAMDGVKYDPSMYEHTSKSIKKALQELDVVGDSPTGFETFKRNLPFPKQEEEVEGGEQGYKIDASMAISNENDYPPITCFSSVWEEEQQKVSFFSSCPPSFLL